MRITNLAKTAQNDWYNFNQPSKCNALQLALFSTIIISTLVLKCAEQTEAIANTLQGHLIPSTAEDILEEIDTATTEST